ncbi:MAG: glycosyltransferase family 2 protein [Patescibacteria group bacterium]
MKITVVIPAWNEERTVGAVVHEVRQYAQEVIVVDDGSSDGTGEVAAREGARVLRHAANRGQGAALQTGISAALARGADIIVTFDADGQFSASEIPRVVAPIASGNVHAALGSRFLGTVYGMPTLRKLMLKAATVFTSRTTGLRLTDTHNGFRAFSRRAAELLALRQDRMAHASEILHAIAEHRLSFCEVPVTLHYNRHTLRKGQRLLNAFHIVFDLAKERFLKRT